MELKSLALALISILFAVMIVTDGFGISFSRNRQQSHKGESGEQYNDIYEVESSEYPLVIQEGVIANLAIGKSFQDLSSDYSNLYNKVTSYPLEKNANGDERCRYTLWKDKELVATVDYNSTKQAIEYYSIYSSRVFLPNGINPTMNLRAALSQQGVSAKAVYRNGGYVISITSDGYELATLEPLTKEAQVKIGFLSDLNPSVELTKDDFDKQAQIEYILVR